MPLAIGDEFIEVIAPERQEFIEMLTILRPFTMDGDDVFLSKIVRIVRGQIEKDESSPNRLNSVHDKFKLYTTSKYDKSSTKYQKKYSKHVIKKGTLNISNFYDVIWDLGEQTVFRIYDLVINGYYFHSDLAKQREIVDSIKEQARSWLGSSSEDDLVEEFLTANREMIRGSFKFRFYELIIDIANCVLELKDLIEELFVFPLNEKLHQESQILHDFLDL